MFQVLRTWWGTEATTGKSSSFFYC